MVLLVGDCGDYWFVCVFVDDVLFCVVVVFFGFDLVGIDGGY